MIVARVPLVLYNSEFNYIWLKMPMLYIKCKTCGMEFPSGIDATKDSLATMHLVNNTHVCPMRHSHKCDLENYYLKE